MSESTSAPAADVSADAAPISPAPVTQEPISISDAARLLRSARQPPAPVESTPPPEQPQASPESTPRRRSGVDAMEEALGLRPTDRPQEPANDTASNDNIQIDGRSWSIDALREQLSFAHDYTHKTQQLAEHTRQVRAQEQQLQEQAQALAQFMPLIQPEIARLQAMLAEAPMPDAALRQQDPASYWEQFARYQDAQAARGRFMEMQQTQAQAQQAAFARAVEEGNRTLAERYPVWGDPAARKEVQDAIVSWARKEGYSDNELRGLTNPRYLETMFKAMSYDRSMDGVRTSAPRPAVAATPPRGNAPPPRPAEEVAAAQQAFDAKPDWRNGARLLSAQRSAATNRGNGHSNW